MFLPICESFVGLPISYNATDRLLPTFADEWKFGSKILQHPKVIVGQTLNFLSEIGYDNEIDIFFFIVFTGGGQFVLMRFVQNIKSFLVIEVTKLRQ